MKNEDFTHAFDALLRSDFKSFMHKVFCTLDSGAKFEDNWHLDAMSETVRILCSGGMTRLVVNIPPRFLKSICYSVALPAWLLGHNPNCKIIVASYSKAISIKHSEDCRFIMDSVWYKRLFPNSKILRGVDRMDKFMTDKRGFRFAASVHGAMTGEGADFIIIDDPQTPLQSCSDKHRKRVINWFQKTVISRLNNKHKGRVIVVMQRLHSEDLSGFLLSRKEKWGHLKLSLCSDNDEEVRIDYKDSAIEYDKVIGIGFKRKKGDLLHESRINRNDINQIKEEMGEYGFLSQYQQEPTLLQGGFVKLHWLRRYDDQGIAGFESIYQSWDCAIKIKDDVNDYSVCITWGEKEGIYYLLDIWRGRLEYPFLIKQVLDLAEQWRTKYVLIEDKASGQQIIQELNLRQSRDLHKLGAVCIPIVPKYDKISRLVLCTSYFEQGKILLPKVASWLKEFELELNEFPNAKYDDQVDALTQFILWKQNVLQQRMVKRKSIQCVDATDDDFSKWKISRL